MNKGIKKAQGNWLYFLGSDDWLLSDNVLQDIFSLNINDYDIVYGPIDDDGVTYQLRRYEGGVISLARLVEELKYAKGITFQYFFGTERALAKLKRV